MMSGEHGTTSLDDLWQTIPEKARDEWAIHHAANDPVVRGVLGVFIKYGYHDKMVEDTIRDALEDRIVTIYGVKPDQSEVVFERAEELIREEMEANGTA